MELNNFFEAELEIAVRDSQLMGDELKRQAQRIVEKTQVNLGVQYLPPERNPAPGPPRRRTGDLQDSIRTTGRNLEGNVEVVALATHGGWPYPRTLLEGGSRTGQYKFITEADLEALSELKGG